MAPSADDMIMATAKHPACADMDRGALPGAEGDSAGRDGDGAGTNMGADNDADWGAAQIQHRLSILILIFPDPADTRRGAEDMAQYSRDYRGMSSARDGADKLLEK